MKVIFGLVKVVGVLATFGILACEKKEPCNRTLESLPLPVAFEVSKDNAVLGVLTVNEDKSLTLAPAANADPSLASGLQDVVNTLSESTFASFSYDERSGNMRHSCGGEVPKEAPAYADGVRMHLYSTHYYDVAIKGE